MTYNRMLKKSASSVLASFRSSTFGRAGLKVGVAEGVFPFAKTHCKGERPTRSAVCTSSDLHSLRPCLGQGRVLARQGWAGEKVAFLSILWECSITVPHVRPIEVLAYQYSFSVA